jgi:hypothetical protein
MGFSEENWRALEDILHSKHESNLRKASAIKIGLQNGRRIWRIALCNLGFENHVKLIPQEFVRPTKRSLSNSLQSFGIELLLC